MNAAMLVNPAKLVALLLIIPLTAATPGADMMYIRHRPSPAGRGAACSPSQAILTVSFFADRLKPSGARFQRNLNYALTAIFVLLALELAIMDIHP